MLAVVNKNAVREEVMILRYTNVVGLDESPGSPYGDNTPSEKSIGRNLPNLYVLAF